MMGMIGPDACRIQPGDRLENLAQKQLGDKATPASVARWVQAAQELNHLDNPNQIRAGQALLLPPIFTVLGQAEAHFSFVDNSAEADAKAEQILALKTQAAQRQSQALQAFPTAQRLQSYRQNAHQAPSQADLRWLHTLAAASQNPNLNYPASRQEQQLKKAVTQALAWQAAQMQAVQLRPQDLQHLSPKARQVFQALMAQDGKSEGLSNLDLAQSNPQAIRDLLNELQQGGFNQAEQKVVQMLNDLSQQPLQMTHLEYAQKPEMPQMVRELNFAPQQGPDKDQDKSIQTQYENNLKQIQQILSDSRYIQKGSWNLNIEGQTLLSYHPSENDAIKACFDSSCSSAEAAKSHLLQEYGFAPEDTHDLDKVKAMAAKLNTPDKVADFISHYMQANFVHSGSTNWTLGARMAETLGLSDALFFGHPPGLDQLPDGRCLMDCEGFSKLSQTLLNYLAPQHQALPITVPGHIFTLAKMDDKMYLFDNGALVKPDFSDAEKAHFSDKAQNFDSAWDSLNPFRSATLTEDDFPSLYRYVKAYPHAQEPKYKAQFTGDFIHTGNQWDTLHDVATGSNSGLSFGS